jgi:hypothetical protein
MNQINQKAGKNSIQTGTVGRDLKIDSGTLYTLDGSRLQEYQAELYPQTITIYLTNAEAWITNVVFHSSASFCY